MVEAEALIGNMQAGQVGLGAIVTIVIFAILRGWLLPVGIHKDRVADKDKQIEALAKERDDWKLAFQNEAAASAVTRQQNSDLIDGAETTNRLMESLRNQIERGYGERHDPQRRNEE